MAVSIDNCDTGPHAPGSKITLEGECDDFDNVSFTVTMNGNDVDYTSSGSGTSWECQVTMPQCPPGATGNQTVRFLVEEGEDNDVCVMGLICP